MYFKLGKHHGRCIIKREPLLFVYRLATRDSQEFVEAQDLAEHWKREQGNAVIKGAAIVRTDFDRVLALYGELSTEEKQMQEVIGDLEFLIVLARPCGIAFLHEACHALYQTDSGFRAYAIDAVMRAPDFDTLSFAVIHRGYGPEVLIEEIAAHMVADFYGQSWILMTGNQSVAEDLRARLLAAVRYRVELPRSE